MRRRFPTVATLVASLALAACWPNNSATPSTTTVDPTRAVAATIGSTLPSLPVPALSWSECGDNLDCAVLAAPLDWADPGTEQVRLPVVRHRALKQSRRIGSLLVNPGGPGFGGTYLAEQARSYFSKAILERFDIVAWDPRGTGKSQPAVDCIDDYDPYFAADTNGSDISEKQASIEQSKRFADACASRNGDLLAHISTQDTARDMELLRLALGEQQISYFGFSYGSELGAVWVTMFPQSVRAAVFDGAADPTSDAMQAVIDQAKGFEIALNAFLAYCIEKCTFPRGEDPGKAFDSVLANIAANDYPTAAGRPTLNTSIAYTAVAKAMYATEFWPALDQALDAARNGDGSGLLRLFDAYYLRNPDGTYTDDLEAFLAISCVDAGAPDTVEGVDAYADEILAAAPRLGPSFLNGYSCLSWPAEPVRKLTITGRGAGAIIVIGTSNDPATPYEGTVKMARALERGVLVSVKADGHLGYLQSECARDVVDEYLVAGIVPSSDVEC